MGADLRNIRRAGFKQADLTRAVRGAEKAGFRVGRIEIDPNGKIVIMPEGSVSVTGEPNEWDTVLR